MLLRMLVCLKIVIRRSICDEAKGYLEIPPSLAILAFFWPCFVGLQNFILLVLTVPFFFSEK